MKLRRDVMICLLTASVAPMASAQAIFKCVSAFGETGYQSTPCAVGSFETRIAPGSARSDFPLPVTRAAPGRASGRKPSPWRHTALTLGMSDDEVLNMAGWGCPGRITRNRLPREWREEWVYGVDTQVERRLHFSNGKLVDFGGSASGDRIVAASMP